MKALSILLLTATTIHAAVTGDATAFTVAAIYFCHFCGRDVINVWNRFIGDTL